MDKIAIMTLVAIYSGLAFPLSARGEMREAPDTGGFDEPVAEICLLPEGMKGNTCAAFFLDDDGFEICLRDEMSGTIRCTSNYDTHLDPPDMPSAFRSGSLGI